MHDTSRRHTAVPVCLRLASHSVPWVLAGGTVGLLDSLVTVGLGLASHDVYGLASHGVHVIASHSEPTTR